MRSPRIGVFRLLFEFDIVDEFELPLGIVLCAFIGALFIEPLFIEPLFVEPLFIEPLFMVLGVWAVVLRLVVSASRPPLGGTMPGRCVWVTVSSTFGVIGAVRGAGCMPELGCWVCLTVSSGRLGAGLGLFKLPAPEPGC